MAPMVEFLPDRDPDEPDDALLDRGGPAGPGDRSSVRRRRLVRAALAAALVASAGIWVATRPGEPPAPAAQPAPQRSAMPTPAPTERRAGSSVVVCAVGAPVATEVTESMHKYFPAIRIDNLNAYRCVRGVGPGRRIVAESVRGHVRSFDIVVALTARGPAGEGIEPNPGLGSGSGPPPLLASISAETAAVKVNVSAFGPSGRRPPQYGMHQLADYLSFNIIL